MPDHTFLTLAAAATSALPDFDVAAVGPPQSATDEWLSTAVLDRKKKRFTVRAARTETAALKASAEAPILGRLLPLVHEGTLPFQVAQLLGSSHTEEGLPLVVYPELPGTPLDVAECAGEVARSLGMGIAAIHNLAPTVVTDLDLPVEDAATIRERWLAEMDEVARTSRVPSSLLNRWEQALEDVALWQFACCVIHGDLTGENLTIDGDRLAAVTNWSGLRIGDPAEDLSWLLATAPEESLDTLHEAYAFARTNAPDTHIIDRALLLSELALARWLLHGVRTENAAVIADADDMLTTLARQVGDDRPLGRTSPVIETGWEETYDEAPDGEQALADGDAASGSHGEVRSSGSEPSDAEVSQTQASDAGQSETELYPHADGDDSEAAKDDPVDEVDLYPRETR
ncbi:MAG: phosphotransferase [Bowdeniella nasicola]|nr:phosphotransferase [Bowdeniella nasicola]